MENNLGCDGTSGGEERQEDISVVQVTEHAVLRWPDATLCSEIQAANSSTSDIKPVKWDFSGKALMNLSHYKRGSKSVLET